MIGYYLGLLKDRERIAAMDRVIREALSDLEKAELLTGPAVRIRIEE